MVWKLLWPYVRPWRWRLAVALALLVAAKVANLGVPLVLKELVDRLTPGAVDVRAVLVVPAALLIGYALLRLSTSLFTELRELVFAKATHGISRQIALATFNHLHGLSLRFHLERQTGGMTRDIERGVQSLQSLVQYSLYTIVPTLVELTLALVLLGSRFDWGYVAITLTALAAYATFTISVTEWRTQWRRQMNELNARAHTRAVDALLNYETVKYFNAEAVEAARYDAVLQDHRRAQIRSQTSLSLLNTGQQAIIAASLLAMLWRATSGVVAGQLTLGDLVLVNTLLLQLYIPLNFLGVLYREVKQSMVDLDRLFALMDKQQEVADAPGATALAQPAGTVRFDDVRFGYEPERPILQGVSFEIPAGHTVAVVGPSGAGKSTLARLLYRFYDVQGGAITVGGQDIRSVTQDSLRRAIGVVPQDTVLFNDSVAYNIGYGREGATQPEIEAAARAARIHDFIVAQPRGYDTLVGERGLKLSGGEKQRVAIARTLLKNPPILIFDEATSALDSANERAIQAELTRLARGKTTLVIAHRLSTIVEADDILVMDGGRIIERGRHTALLAAGGAYARMWHLQHSVAATP
ncbi:MAG: ABC transporter ATP-binding protein/permease [Proteobacteria bacterium]|nr:ABC transporter ATP-binding protein/permease [Pseudomonadota bacterium]